MKNGLNLKTAVACGDLAFPLWRAGRGVWLVLLVALWLAGPGRSQAQTNGIYHEIYTNISGSTIGDLLNSSKYPNRPDFTETLTNYVEGPTGFGSNYGQRMRGFLTPPATGIYVFWIASDDQSVLSLSTDDNPANKRDIASVISWTSLRQWDKTDSQMSVPINLEAGHHYYFEVVMKQGSGGDNLTVRWQLPDASIEEPMSAKWFLLPWVPIHAPVIISQPTNSIAYEGASAVFQVQVSNLDPVSYHWQRNGLDIPGASQPGYTNLAASVADNGARYTCVITNRLGVTNSDPAQLTVVPDTTPPILVSVVNTGSTNLMVVFSEPVHGLNGTNNFSLNNGVKVLSISQGQYPNILLLTTSPLDIRTPYTLSVYGVTDRSAAANRIDPNSKLSFVTSELSPQDIGRPVQQGLFMPVANGFRLTAGGTDIGGNSDQFQFSSEIWIGDFDFKLRIQSLGLSDPWAKAGLMARESLDANSRFAGVFATPNISGCVFESRSTTGGVASVSGNWPVNYPDTWLRLKREGNLFTGFASYDGNGWAPMGSILLPATNKIYLGIAVTSHNPSQTTVAEVRDWSNSGISTNVARLPRDYERIGPSSRRTGLVFSEIMYHPAARADGKQLEFVELFNSDPVSEDLSGFRLAGAVDYTFPAGTVLPAGSFLMVAQSPANLATVYGLSNVQGPYAGQLSNQADNLRLVDNLGGVFLEVPYSSTPPWPVTADGAGHSLVLAHPSYGEGHPAAWAASDKVGGSPGQVETLRNEPLRSVVINEFLANSGPSGLDFIELYNHSNALLDISGCSLSDNPDNDKFLFPANTSIPPRGFVVIDENQLGFALSSAGETIYFKNRDRSRVLDALRFDAQAEDVSMGRYPDGAPDFHELSVQTPGASNKALLIRDIVINEIMFSPLSDDNDDQFVELYNQSTNTVSLNHWRFVDGIQFTFPAGAVIPGQGYLVLSKNAAHLISSYTNLNATNLIGDFQGNLAGSGERLALARPDYVLVTNANGSVVSNRVYIVVDEVTYGSGGRWGKWSDGGGSSLELIDPHSDHRLAANWADSDESGKSVWTTIEHTGVLDNGYNGYGIDNLQFFMLGEGECLVDNVEVVTSSGLNLIANSTFEGGLAGYELRGTHRHSFQDSKSGYGGGNCLHIVASGGGDTGPNQILVPLAVSLSEGVTVTIRAKVRWLRGCPEILFRLHGNYLEAAGAMTVPSNLGTPGVANNRFLTNAGPAIFDVAHYPVLPANNEAVLITARVHDPDGLASVTLNYRLDPASSVNSIKMADDGTGGDEVAGDGIFSATLPPQPVGILLAFSIQAKDKATQLATNSFPNDAPVRECLIRYGETPIPGNFETYRIWFTQKTLDEWINREKGSSEPLDATFVYGNHRAFYNIGAYYHGSPYHWGGYNSPMGNNCTYSLVFPKDNLLMGAGDFILTMPSNLGSDPTVQREQFTHWIARQLGLPYTHRRFVNVYVNGLKRGNIFEDAQRPNGEYLDQWLPLNSNGNLHKIDDWFEFGPSPAFSFHNTDATLENFTTTGGEKKVARYRWNWRKRAVKGSENDFSSLLALVDAVNATSPADFTKQVEALVDMNNWMRTMATRHMVGDWDSYGYRRGKNMYAFKPDNGKWQLFNWDISFDLGLGDGPTTASLFDVTHLSGGTIDPITDRMFKHPPFLRIYLRALQDAANGPLLNAKADPVMDAKYAALKANGVPVSAPDPIKTYIKNRRNNILTVLATNAANFAILSNNGEPFRTNRSVVALNGTAAIEVETIKVNGVAYPLTWSSVTNWNLQLPVQSGDNRLVVQGYNHTGGLLTNAAGSIVVSYTGPSQPPQDYLVINEIMYHPDILDTEYVEIFNASMIQTFDLSQCVLNGLDFAFADGIPIAPQSFVLVVKNRLAFEAAYGTGLPVVGEYLGQLQFGGETLSLIKPGTTPMEDTLLSQVTYDNNPPWPTAAEGTGASLQLIDPLQDNNRAGNWDAVGANGLAKPRWQFVSVTGTATGSRLTLSLSVPGEVFLDDLSLVAGIVPRVGVNFITNGDFETPLADAWQVSSNYASTAIATTIAHAGTSSLRLATAPGVTNASGAASFDIQTALATNQFYTLSYWYLPNVNGGSLSVKIDGNGLAALHNIRPDTIAIRTPGAPNSVRATLPDIPALWINEVQPVNLGVVADQAGENDPWIELFNAGPKSLDLSGYYLSTSYTNLTQWAFPAHTLINSGQYLLVWTDGQPEQSISNELHTSFRLNPSTGVLALSRMDMGQPTIIDYLNYASLTPSQSYGSYPDGNPRSRQVFQTPTPGAANSVMPVTVLINEWMASNAATIADPVDGKFSDWFELYNPGPIAVDLSRYSLTDELTNATQFVIPAGTRIGSHGFLLVWADNDPQQNQPGRDLHVNFKLSKNGSAIALFNPGGSIMDMVSYGSQTTDVSQGRWPDGQAAPFYFLPAPTPGAVNANPIGAAGILRITGVQLSAGVVAIYYQSEPGRVYQAQYKDTLATPNWTNLGNPLTSSTANSKAEDAINANGQRFYRVIQIQP